MKYEDWKSIIAAVVVVGYLISGLITFGYAAANTNNCLESTEPNFCRAINGIGSGIIWPLYWSWEVAEWYTDE